METYDTNEEKREMAEKCAAVLACVVYNRGESCLELELFGLRQNGVELGDWRVTIECVNHPGHDC